MLKNVIMKNLTCLLIIFLFCVACNTQVNNNLELRKTDITESKINEAVGKAYSILDFNENTPANSDGIRDVFVSNPNFMNFSGDSLVVMSIDGLVHWHKEAVASDEITLFHEVEIWGKTEYFGDIAHRLSTYATYINTMDSVYDRGVNSFQLVKIDGKWLVNSIIWDVESEELPIPAKYTQAI